MEGGFKRILMSGVTCNFEACMFPVLSAEIKLRALNGPDQNLRTVKTIAKTLFYDFTRCSNE